MSLRRAPSLLRIAPALLAVKLGLPRRRIVKGIVAALGYCHPLDPQSLLLAGKLEALGLPAVLSEVCGIEAGSQLAEEMGGYVVSANMYQTILDNGVKVPYVSITIRVPAERMEEAMRRIREQSNQDPLSENISSEELAGFSVADLYPENTTWNGNWWVRWGPWMTATHDLPNRRLDFWVERLGPGDTAGIGFQVDLDGGLIGQQGQAFTNIAQVPVAGDVYPADNEAAAAWPLVALESST